jgi:MFS superfamily sulfate permease-like transporter
MLSAGYSVEDALTDALAGFTVALCVIPQSIAMAIIAELPPQVQSH